MLAKWRMKKINFVIRLKKNILYTSVGENPLPDDDDQHILVDELIKLDPENSGGSYPGMLRRVVVWDDMNKQAIEILTNQLTWTAATIAELYKQRWQIEIFFKSLNQLLKIKTFVGISKNAVLIQIWPAVF